MASDQNRLQWGCCPKSRCLCLVSSPGRFPSHALDTMLKFVGYKMFTVSSSMLVLIMIDVMIVWSVQRFGTRCLSQLSLWWCWWLRRSWDADDLGMLMTNQDWCWCLRTVGYQEEGWLGSHTMLAGATSPRACERACTRACTKACTGALELALELAIELAI